MTQRTKAELDAFFIDNTLGLITPAQLRDFVESCTPSMAGMHFADPGALTDILAVATWTKAANVSTLHDASRFDMPFNNRLRYTGLAAGTRALVQATLSFQCALNNQVCSFALFKNGLVNTPSIMRTKISTGADLQAVTIQALLTLAANDYVEVFVRNDTSDADITIDHGHVLAVAHLT